MNSKKDLKKRFYFENEKQKLNYFYLISKNKNRIEKQYLKTKNFLNYIYFQNYLKKDLKKDFKKRLNQNQKNKLYFSIYNLYKKNFIENCIL